MLQFPKPDLLKPPAHCWLKTNPIVILAYFGHKIFVLLQVIAIFISLHPQYCLQPVDLEELMSAGVQTLTGLYGITMTGYVFFLGRIDSLVQADWTIGDVVDALKNRFVHMIYGISTTFLLSLFLCGLSAYLQGRAIQLPLYVHFSGPSGAYFAPSKWRIIS